MKILARISLLATDEGGRAQPYTGSFRPNHSFEQGTFAIGEVEQPVEVALHPGASAELIVHFIHEGVPHLNPGREWKLYDGPAHLIGSATVLQVLET